LRRKASIIRKENFTQTRPSSSSGHGFSRATTSQRRAALAAKGIKPVSIPYPTNEDLTEGPGFSLAKNNASRQLPLARFLRKLSVRTTSIAPPSHSSPYAMT